MLVASCSVSEVDTTEGKLSGSTYWIEEPSEAPVSSNTFFSPMRMDGKKKIPAIVLRSASSVWICYVRSSDFQALWPD